MEAQREVVTHRKVFTLLVEMRCNSYCVFCGQREVDEALVASRRRLGLSVPQTNYGATRGRYTLETATEALARARAEGFGEISFQGGEPTLFPELPELVRRARSLGFAFTGVVTNGRKLRDRAFAGALVEAGLDGISISLLGADAETHDALSAAPGAFDALVAGLRNVVAEARERGRPIKINANLIVSARSVDALADEVRLLAELGAHAAQVHLVRFKGLGADPGVREPLRFDARRLTGALAGAYAAADASALSLHATDVPLCLHPTLRAQEIELVARRAAIAEHHFEGAAFSYDVDPSRPHASPPACDGCFLAARCPRVPPEYLPADPASVLVPQTAEVLARRVDDALAAVDPRSPSAVPATADLAHALAEIDALGGVDVTAPRSRVREALADLALFAAARRDALGLISAFCGAADLFPPTRFTLDAAGWQALARPLSALAVHAAAVPRAPGARVGLGTFELAVDGTMADGALDVTDLRPVVPAAATPAERLVAAVFLLCFAEPLRRALPARIDGSRIDAAGGLLAWRGVRDGAIRVVPAT